MLKPNDAHSFVIKDEDLFTLPMATDLRALKCGVCGGQPGQGVHVPPPPPLSRAITDEVAKTIAATYQRDWKGCLTEASRAAFTTVQHVREFLKRMGQREGYADPDIYGDIDTALNEVLTELRQLGWGDQQGT